MGKIGILKMAKLKLLCQAQDSDFLTSTIQKHGTCTNEECPKNFVILGHQPANSH